MQKTIGIGVVAALAASAAGTTRSTNQKRSVMR